jgi:hypothetical protein
MSVQRFPLRQCKDWSPRQLKHRFGVYAKVEASCELCWLKKKSTAEEGRCKIAYCWLLWALGYWMQPQGGSAALQTRRACIFYQPR